jgi:hypothetical protein
MWNKKHDQLSAKSKITPSAQLLWRYLIWNQLEGKGQELDLEECFNAWIAKYRGKGFDRKTLKTALAQLDRVGIVKILTQYTWRRYKIVCWQLNQIEKNSQIQENSHEKLTPKKKLNPNQIKAFKKKQQKEALRQQQLEQVNNLCQSIGVKFQPDILRQIAWFGVEQLTKAVEHFKYQSVTQVIGNPEG